MQTLKAYSMTSTTHHSRPRSWGNNWKDGDEKELIRRFGE